MRGQIATKDLQISELTERSRETNVLIGGLQRLLAPLLGSPDPQDRGKAAEALGRAGSHAASALPTLAHVLTDFARYRNAAGSQVVSEEAAHAWLAINYWMGWAQLGDMPEPNCGLALTAARKAVALDPDDATGHMILGYIRLYGGDWREAVAEFDTALRINPNHADTWAMLTDRMVFESKPGEAIDCVQKALRLNPHPPGWYYWMLGFAQYAAGRYAEAVDTLRREETYRSPSQRLLAASLAQLGHLDEAADEVGQILTATPNFSIRHWSDTQPFRDEKVRQHFIDGFRKAGLPE